MKIKRASDPVPPSSDSAVEIKIWKVLQSVVDPELHYNIVDLGLVYDVSFANGEAKLRMTLTSPGCPYGPYLIHETRQAVRSVDGVERVGLELVWDPPWSPARMTEEIRLEMGFDI